LPAIARKGDAGSHGGTITTGAARSFCEGAEIARVDDIYACAIHGAQPIVAGSVKLRVEGKACARVGDATACGAVITTGAAKSFDE
jgi:uncharacterized Zn-binding protein involved in type VI secretion